MTSVERLQRAHEDADADLEAQTRALTERGAREIHAAVDNLMGQWRRTVQDCDGFGRPHVVVVVGDIDE